MYDFITVLYSLVDDVSEIFRKYFFGQLRRICDAYHEHEFKVMFHSDGNLMEIMDDLVDAGIDGINPIEVQSGMNLKELKDTYGPKLTMCGGMDVHVLLRRGTKEEVAEGVRRAILESGESGGLLLGSTTELDNDVPPENIITMFETAKSVGSYSSLKSGL